MRVAGKIPWLLLIAWLIVQALWSLPDDIARDWKGWRQSDTQSIAVNFMRYGDGILSPRVNWGGDGPGYVETEFQLFAYSSSLLMRVFGVSERPGQWISLLSLVVASGVLFTALGRRFGRGPALLSLAAVLASRSVIFVSTTVQPDALAFLFCVLSFVAFLDYLDTARVRALALTALWTTLAALVKPTALHLGVFQFLAVAWLRRDQLARPGIWIAWAAILAGLGLHMARAHSLYQEYGNTFGIGLGGDSKFPSPAVLADPQSWLELARVSLAWGFGWQGAAAGLYLLLVRRLDAVAVSLGVANLVMLLVAFRYTSFEGYGAHYHLVTVLLVAWLIALATRDAADRITRSTWRLALGGAALAALMFLAIGNWELRSNSALIWSDQLDSVAAGEALREFAGPGALVVVRSDAKARDERYGVDNNFEDPILLYVADARGWVLPSDEPRIETLEEARRAGARFYIDNYGLLESPALDEWLGWHCEQIVYEPGRFTIYEIYR